MDVNENKKSIVYAKGVEHLGVGYKLKKYKREKKKKEFSYLSRKQYKKYTEDQKNEPELTGYFKVRKFKNDGERILSIKDEPFDLYDKKKKLSRTIGYVKTDVNAFSAMQRSMAWLLILLLLFIALMISGAVYSIKHPGVIPKPWNPTIEKNIGGEDGEAEGKKAEGIQVKGFTTWSIPVNASKNLSIPLENPEGNPCYFSFEIVLSDTGEVIYSSDMVPPGKKISRVNLTHGFDAGEYPATINIKTNELTTGQEMNSPAIQIIIHVS